MSQYTFEHDGPVYLLASEKYDSVYYARDKKFYRRIRYWPNLDWGRAVEDEIDKDIFMMTIACIERRSHNASH